MPRLILRLDDRVLKRCALSAVVTIGRLPGNTIVIDGAAVSGHHACVSLDGDRFVLEDLDSTNGTFVNDEPVKGERELTHDDLLKIGPIQFKVSLQAGEPARTPAPPTKAASRPTARAT